VEFIVPNSILQSSKIGVDCSQFSVWNHFLDQRIDGPCHDTFCVDGPFCIVRGKLRHFRTFVCQTQLCHHAATTWPYLLDVTSREFVASFFEGPTNDQQHLKWFVAPEMHLALVRMHTKKHSKTTEGVLARVHRCQFL